MTQENIRPPPNCYADNAAGQLRFILRLLFDLRVSSVVRDLKPILGTATGRVLEVGCGLQPYRFMLSKNCSYVGLDWHNAVKSFGYKCNDVVLYDGEKFPFADDGFDMIFHTEVLEHVWDTREFLSECFRVLQPGGIMYFMVPFAARYHYIPNDYWRFTESCLERLCNEAGFRDVDVKPRGGDLAVACYKIQTACLRLSIPNDNSIVVNILRAFSALILWIPFLGATIFGQLFNHLGIGSKADPHGYFVRALKLE
jgi:SAM-dependent methyltransferase